jgi:hypothetical protein
MVWADDNTNLYYSVKTGSSWSTATAITETNTTEPKQIRLESDPTSNEMVMVVNFQDEKDYAFSWNPTGGSGSGAWSSERLLDSNTGHDRTDINVAYEAKSGDAMFVYASGTTGAVGYQIWNGGTWTDGASWTTGTISPPTGPNGYAKWTDVDSDPTSNNIVLGVLTSGNDTWMNVWKGTANTWGTAQLGATNAPVTDSPGIAVEFESTSGEAMAVYGSGTVAAYRTWDPGTGNWSSQTTVPGGFVNGNTNTILLDGKRRRFQPVGFAAHRQFDFHPSDGRSERRDGR